MKRLLMAILLGTSLVALSAGTVFGWSWGAHAFITENIGSSRLPAKSNEIYGCVAPDVFNFLFANPQYMGPLATATHIQAEDVWDSAKNQPEREFAFGFASHNEAWGADNTAHLYGQTFRGPANNKGYVVAKADVLLAAGLQKVFDDLSLPQQAADLMAHVLVEDAIDLMLAEKFPNLGADLSRAALHRNQLFPKLLVDAYGDIAPASVILETEEWYRGYVIFYGQLLQQSPEVAQQMMAALLADQAKAYLALFPGVTIPDDALLIPLAFQGLTTAKLVCTDYMTELNATMDYVREQMVNQGMQD